MVSKDELLPYQDREHALVKHKLFEHYLERFVMILGRYKDSLAFVDAFAGPWKSQKADYSDTSFGRAVSTIKDCRLSLRKTFNARPRCRALFFENDADAFSELQNYAQSQSSYDLLLEARNERFEENVGSIANWIKTGEHAFVLVDPKGYDKLIDPRTLAPLLDNPRAELLINYMWQFLNLATGHVENNAHRENLIELFGHGFEEALILPPAEKESALIRRYMQRLREASSTDGDVRLRVMCFPVEYADKKGNKYYLVYATHNSTGLITFAEEMEKAAKEQRDMKHMMHFTKREESSNTIDMFTNSGVEQFQSSPVSVSLWLDELPDPGSEIVVDEEAWANLLEKHNCYPSTLQLALGELVKSGKFEVVGVSAKRKSRFVHPKKKEVVRRLT
jgi:three-Cys-motif partner protein